MKAAPRRRRRLVPGLLGFFAIYSLAGFFLAPVIVKQQLVKHASAALHRPVTVEQVRVNPWALALTIRGLAVAGHDGTELAGWDEFHANFQASSLFRRTWFFDTIRLARPHGRLAMAADGTLNIADLIPPSTAAAADPAPARPPPPVAVAHFIVEHGEFSHLDRRHTPAFETHLGPTSFELHNFTTRPKRSGNYTFTATTESGETLAWSGTFTFAPLGSAGHLEIAGIKLAKYAPYYRDRIRFEVTGGSLALGADYTVDLSGEPAARLHNGNCTVTDLRLLAPGADGPFLAVPEFRLDNLAADTAARSASLDRVLVRGAALAAARRPDGTLDLVELLKPVAAVAPPAQGGDSAQPVGHRAEVAIPSDRQIPAPASSPTAAGEPPTDNRPSSTGWSANLGKLEIVDASLRLTDHSTPRPAQLTVDQLALTLSGAGTQLDRDVTLETALRCNQSGRITLSGTVRPQPLAAELEVAVDDFALRPLDPYLAPFLNVLITGGTARVHGHLSVATDTTGTPVAHWTGDAGLANFATVDADTSEPLAGFADLALTQLEATSSPLALSVAEVSLQTPFARVVVLPDRTINLTSALKGAGPVAPPAEGGDSVGHRAEVANPEDGQVTALAHSTTAHSSPVTDPLVTIAKVTITDGRFAFTDRSIDPVFTRELTGFGGTISGLSSQQLARADLDLTGKLGVATLHIGGQINPLSDDAYSDIKVAVTGIELPPFTPYSGRFAGYTIDKGKLSLDLSYRLSARELVAENKIVFDQFHLGQSVDSPEAVKLPLKLALAILRERDGRIPIDLPIRGNLDDPDFRYGGAVMRALGNLIVKAATAPFSMLGGLFGGGRDLSLVEFASGSAACDDEALARLAGLAKALTERPALRLEIASLPQPALDLAGLREAKLEALLRARHVRELATGSSAPIDPATVTLSAEDTARLLTVLHAERCPPAGQPVGPVSDWTPTTPAASPASATTAATTTAANTASPGVSSEAHLAKPETRNPKPNLLVRTARRIFGTGEKSGAPAAAPVAPPAPGGESTDPAEAGPTLDQLRADVLATIEPTAEDYAMLAAQRAETIQQHLLAQGGIDPARVFVATLEAAAEPTPVDGAAPRVVFNLQ